MNKVNLALQVIPLVESAKVFAVVDKAIDYIKSSGIKYYVTPFETVLEGNINELFELVKGVQNLCHQIGAEEIIINIKIHSVKDKDVYINEKMANYT